MPQRQRPVREFSRDDADIYVNIQGDEPLSRQIFSAVLDLFDRPR